MAVYVYAPNETDFDTMGLCGPLTPISCLFTEKRNGLSQLVLTHPIDDEKRYEMLVPGCVLKADVPVRTTPEIEDGALVTTVEKWVVKTTATKAQRRLFTKASGGRVIKVLPKGLTITVVRKKGDRYRAKTKYGAGWVNPAALSYSVTETIPNDPTAIEQAEPAWATKPQLFRIRTAEASEKSKGGITVTASHIFYDLAGNITSYDTNKTYDDWSSKKAYVAGDAVTVDGASYRCTVDNKNQKPPNADYWMPLDSCVAALEGILSSCSMAHEFDGYTNLLDKRVDVKWTRVGAVEALLAPDSGLLDRWGAELIRDNYEIYILREAGLNRGVRIEYGRNLLGVTMTTDVSGVITRVLPVGKTHKGKPLLLAAGTFDINGTTVTIPSGETWVTSERESDYPAPNMFVLETDIKAKSGSASDVNAARKKMIEAALQKFSDEECDQPSVNLQVDFVNLGDTVEYQQYKNLDALYLCDRVRVKHPKLGIDVLTEVIETVWDCLTGRFQSIELGRVQLDRARIKVPVWQLPSGIPGTIILPDTMDGGALIDGSVNDGAFADGAVTAPAIAYGAVDMDRLGTDVTQQMTATAEQAATAMTAANGKNTIIYSSTEPPTNGRIAGDTWFDTDDGNRIYNFDGTKWVAAQLGAGALSANSVTAIKLADDAVTAAKISDGAVGSDQLAQAVKTTISTAQATASNAQEIANTAQAAADAAQAAASAAQADANTAQADADAAQDAADTAQSIANAAQTAATAAQDAAGAAATAAAAAQTTADGKNKVVRSTAAPSSASGYKAGDQWWVYSGGTVTALYLHSGSAWVTQTLTNAVIANLDAAKITTGYLNAARIAASTITGTQIKAGTVTAANMVAGTITAASGIIADAAIGSAQIMDAAITTAKIGDAQITNAKIANLDAAKITTGYLNAARIAASTITADKLTVEAKQEITMMVKPGGTNLVPTTNATVSGGSINDWSAVGENYAKSPVAFALNGVGGDVSSLGVIGGVALSPGQQYTLSFWAWWYKAGGGDRVGTLHWNLYHDAPYYDLYDDSFGINIDDFLNNLSFGTPTKYSFTFTMPTGVTASYADWSLRFVLFGNDSAERTFYATDPKIETGNVATDWSPSPKDPAGSVAAGTTVKITPADGLEVTQTLGGVLPTKFRANATQYGLYKADGTMIAGAGVDANGEGYFAASTLKAPGAEVSSGNYIKVGSDEYGISGYDANNASLSFYSASQLFGQIQASRSQSGGIDGFRFVTDRQATVESRLKTVEGASKAFSRLSLYGSVASLLSYDITRPGQTTYIDVNALDDRIYTSRAITNLSDGRFKQSVSDLDADKFEALIMALRPVRYKYLSESPDGLEFHSGVIAQEVQSALSALDMSGWAGFSGENADRLGVAYEEFIAPVIAVIQKHGKTITALQTQIETLADQLAALENRWEKDHSDE